MNLNHKTIEEKLVYLLEKSRVLCNIDTAQCYEYLSQLIGDARVVLMGESTHGTAEFYKIRMMLSEYLVREKGFQAIAIEGDWTSTYAINNYCRGSAALDGETALAAFNRFPTWMWRNTLMLNFIKGIQKKYHTSFYGLDLYCLTESIQAVIDYLKRHSLKEAEKAEQRYACFDHANLEPQLYSYLIEKSLKKSCIREVTTQFLETQHFILQKLMPQFKGNEMEFYVLQNARVVKNAENYYRSLLEPSWKTWNIRDYHMADTLQNIMAHLEDIHQKPAKVIVWAHNSHVGDARATEMSERQEVNLGQLVRERLHTSSFLLGFSTAEGHVTAATEWGGVPETQKLETPIPGSYEALFHALKQDFILNLRLKNELTHLLKSPQLQRAIGVIYRPETERISHYYFSRLPYQFDAILHLDKTQPLIPLD